MQLRHRGFTLVEILIVVVILGVLSAIVVPQFADSTNEAAAGATRDQLRKLRDAIAIYQIRNGYDLPNITEGEGSWGELISTGGEYLKRPPMNRWIGTDRGRRIIFGTSADTAYQVTHGWIFDRTTGDVWAGGFDADDEPHQRP
jgi:general secretion pathway protein G